LEIIPVIDLMGGQVVHACRGHRHSYQAIKTPLSPTSDPISVVHGLLGLADFKTVYVADLDALMGHGSQARVIRSLTAAYPHLRFWVDCGLSGANFTCGQVVPVIGSESMTESALEKMPGNGRSWILSLDFCEGRLLGPVNILAADDLWPERIIVMNLSRVGSFDGPDLSGLARFILQYPGHHFVAAGGVRNERDLKDLQQVGVTEVLVASALHSGAIGPEVLSRFNP